MREIDPYKGREREVTPVVTTTPVVDPTTVPVGPGPVIVDHEYRGGPNPFPYIAGLVLLVLGLWGLFAFTDRDRVPERETVGYVEQTLEPTYADRAPLQPTSSRMAEDRVRDDLTEVRRQEIVRDNTRAEGYTNGGGQTVQANYDNQVASVDLSNESATRQPAPAPTPAAQVPPALPDQAEVDESPEVAVQDLDYSDREIPALTEFDLRAQLTQLDADIDATEGMARDKDQSAGLEVLEERFDALEDRVGDTGAPLQQADLVAITRQLYELRDELSAFQSDLRAL